jgi:large subunit ribosomal protein L9
LAARIRELTLTFTAKAGDSGKLYGSITTSQVADEMNQKLGTDIDRRKVGGEPLRQLGEHQVVIRLSGDFQPELTVVIQPEGRAPLTTTAAAAPADSEAPVTETEEEVEVVEAVLSEE